MKALGKRKSNKEGTLLPVLSGGMSRAAVNKCVSNSERKREGEARRKQERNNCAEHGTLSLGPADDHPREYVLTRRKLLNARRMASSFVDVEIRLASLSLRRRVSFGERAEGSDRSIGLLIEYREASFGKRTERKSRTHQDSAFLRDYDTVLRTRCVCVILQEFILPQHKRKQTV